MKKMSIFKRFSSVLVLSLSALTFTNTYQATAQTQSLFDIISSSADHDTLEAAIIAAGLQTSLSSSPAKTIFAPTDAAFAALPTGTLSSLLATPQGELRDILLYHVLNGSVTSSSLTNGQLATTLNTSNTIKVTVRSNNGGVFVNQAKVTNPDIVANNGVLHVIDKVILPNKTVVDVALGSTNHTTLVQAVIAAELLPSLTDPFSKFTVFAPTNDAFNALPSGTLTTLLATPTGDLRNILLYHVLGAEAKSTSLTNGQLVASLNNANTIKVTIKSNSGGVFVNQAKVTTFDLSESNGVVHVIDKVILPNKTVVDVALGSTNHTTLVQAVIAAELLPSLTDPFSKFTVFAPTNDAFNALPSGTLTSLLATPTGDLRNILLYHVLGAEVLSTTLTDGQVAQTLLTNQNITVNLRNGGVFVNVDAQVTTPDLTESNGVVHVLNKVLTPSVLSSTYDGIMDGTSIIYDAQKGKIQLNGMEESEFYIYNVHGIQVMSSSASASNQIDVYNLNTGLYVLKLENGTSFKFVR